MTTVSTRTQSSHLLRKALQGNAVFSMTSGSTAVLTATTLAEFIGLEATGILRFIGLNLILFATALYWLSRQSTINRRMALTAVILDALWVLGSLLLLVTGILPITSGGQWLIGIIALLVGSFAVLQYLGVRQMTHKE